MLLTFAPRSRHKRFVVNSRRQRKHRAGYVDVVIGCQNPADRGWRTGNNRQSVGKIGARGHLDNFCDADEDIVKDVDLTIRIGGRSGNKDVGKLLEYFGTAFGRAANNGVVDFLNQRAQAHAAEKYVEKMGGALKQRARAEQI